MKNFDFLVVGGGIVGLTVARQLSRQGHKRIGILEKEPELGCHASGRNSGVLHSGIYYGADSLKAKVCTTGGRLMREYAEERRIPILTTGKVIVAPTEAQLPQIDILYKRAQANGVRIEKVDAKRIREIEPEATDSFGSGLFSPETAMIDTKGVLRAIEAELLAAGVEVRRNEEVVDLDPSSRVVRTKHGDYGYGHLINAAGLHADRIAHRMGVGKKYRIIPFKGVYRKLTPEMAARFRGAIYPTPDLRVPFLGVHITRTVEGDVIVGPTAIPAFGRENYGLISGISLRDTPFIATSLLSMLLRDTGGFRTLVFEELGRYRFKNFVAAGCLLAPGLRPEHFLPYRKVGLRAQLVDVEKMRLEMDFVIEKGPSSTHVLNAVSPAFTASLAFAKWVTDRMSG